ncbi:hypothetical protein GpartN1_g3674.t1 [Galdieria partita]|uniref:Cytochrome c oxidase subunit VIIc n=1 Tax=Galdieria partita TaxID=83374 RepID=A0A9C7PW81_9RHOD|nr:hypothetical protein GpartN1_g3674.t1 [Galdieria partita]
MAMLLKSASVWGRVVPRSSAPKGLAQIHTATPTLFKVQDADFMHSDRLYKFAVKPPKKWKLQLFLFTFVASALGTPAFVVWFSNKKAGIW